MTTPHELRCTGCAARVAGDKAPSDFRCEACGSLFEVVYAWSEAPAAGAPGGDPAPRPTGVPNSSALRWLWQERRTSSLAIDQSGVWRFRDLLPIVRDFERVTTLREGNTPLYDLPRAAHALGIHWVLAKHQGMNPTGSFKDTGMTAALSVAAERGFEWVACASTGNTSAAMAAYAARAGLRSIVFIPEGKIAWGKLSQSMDYGALTVQLRADFDGCVRLVADLVKTHPVYLLNSVNPYRLEGQKTPAFELCEQMDWQVPEHVVCPGGNLANASALAKGFREMRQLGLIASSPRISIVQAEGANPLFRAMENNGGEHLDPVIAETRASAIRIGNPASWKKAVNALRTTGGWCEQVNEQEIALAKAEIGAEGIGCEPASAVTLAGLKKLVANGRVSREQRVVLILTGHTLKDSEYTIRYHQRDLLNGEEEAGVSAADARSHAALRKPPLVLDADRDTVLRAMDVQLRVPVTAAG